jgi:hypothetical protein
MFSKSKAGSSVSAVSLFTRLRETRRAASAPAAAFWARQRAATHP